MTTRGMMKEFSALLALEREVAKLDLDLLRIGRRQEAAIDSRNQEKPARVPEGPVGPCKGAPVCLCLPLIRPIGSRRSAKVFVMEPTDAWHLHHPALARRLHAPWLGCVLGQ